MSDQILSKIATLLQAKQHETNPLNRGAFVQELVDALGLPKSSVNAALADETDAARWGIYKMTPKKKRHVLWGYSYEVAERAQALPYDLDALAGIDKKVQAAEVSKLVSNCPEPADHHVVKVFQQNCNALREMFGLSVEQLSNGEIMAKAFQTLAAAIEQEQNDDGEE